MNTIDWKFVRAREGLRLEGYVPEPETSDSGVTIACGFDLGQCSPDSLIGLPPGLASRLTPYLGLRRSEAVHALSKKPLEVSESEAELLSERGETATASALGAAYMKATGRLLDTLPGPVQTVLASVAYQYGNLSARTPRLWRTAVEMNWDAMEHELRNFNDAYQSRRELEAKYLRDNLINRNLTS